MQKFITLVNGAHKLVDGGVVASTGTNDAGKMAALDNSGRLDTTVMPVGIGADTASILTSETLPAGCFVNVWNNFGNAAVRKADATVVGKEAHGFVLSAFTHPTSATVYFEGSNTAVSGAIAGNVFLSTVAGGFTNTPPSASGNIVQKIGVATSGMTINVEFSEAVELA